MCVTALIRHGISVESIRYLRYNTFQGVVIGLNSRFKKNNAYYARFQCIFNANWTSTNTRLGARISIVHLKKDLVIGVSLSGFADVKPDLGLRQARMLIYIAPQCAVAV